MSDKVDKDQDSKELREDLLKSAVSFLSSANVQSAEKEKKVAFLQKKGLTPAEIEEAFERASNSPVKTIPAARSLPVVPSRANAPQIIYQPSPAIPSMPAENVFALAVILGMGTVGLTSLIIGTLKRYISPIFNRIAEYQGNRYKQRKEILDKLTASLSKYDKENDNLDAVIDQGEENTVLDAVIKHQDEVNMKLIELTEKIKDQLSNRKESGINNVKSILSVIETGYDFPNPSISSCKSDIRTLKAILLNRRNFPQ